MKTYRNGAILAVLVAIMVFGTAFSSANAATGLSITLEKTDDQKVMVSGSTGSSRDITMQILSPIGNRVEINQFPPTIEMTYEGFFTVGGDSWTKDGIYTVNLAQGKSTATAKIDVKDGIVVKLFDFVGSYVMTDKIGQPIDSIIKTELGLTLVDISEEGSVMIMVTGNTDKSEEITVRVKSPNGNFVGLDQISPNADGTFAINMRIGGDLGKQDGLYTITAQQGDKAQYIDNVEVEIVDGVIIPEFGSAAIIVLVVAIVSIVAITSRSRLSIQPKL